MAVGSVRGDNMEPRLCLTMERLLRQLGNRAHERLSIKTYFQPIL